MNFGRIQLLVVSLCFLAANVFAQDQEIPKSSDITFDKATASYAMGYRLGIQLAQRKESEFSLDMEEAIKGIRAGATEADPAFTKEQMSVEFANYNRKLQVFQAEEYQKLADESQKRSDDFLKINRSKKGIKELASGIQYRVIEEGAGKNPTMESTVSMNYRGSLIGLENFDNYQEFESTYTRGQPMEVKVGDVGMPGWKEIIPMMRAGDKWQVFFPPEMGFGVRGRPPIGPNEVLVYDVHLLEVK